MTPLSHPIWENAGHYISHLPPPVPGILVEVPTAGNTSPNTALTIDWMSWAGAPDCEEPGRVAPCRTKVDVDGTACTGAVVEVADEGFDTDVIFYSFRDKEDRHHWDGFGPKEREKRHPKRCLKLVPDLQRGIEPVRMRITCTFPLPKVQPLPLGGAGPCLHR